MSTLQRFLDAQASSYSQALSELACGEKRSHWIWYILPRLQGLGHSRMSMDFGINGRQEAADYIAHPVLGERLIQCVKAVLRHPGKQAVDIFGDIDAQKFCSCLTLFQAVAPQHPCFAEALEVFYGGRKDARTLELLNPASADERRL
ncbi:MAG: DUF1810 domain-containing protein [Verrucomicrobia bacterium]|nr:DUF1810 domain-containing protein [Verrucomicrobiota bacterium]